MYAILFIFGVLVAVILLMGILADTFGYDCLDENNWSSEFDKYPADKDLTVDESLKAIKKDIDKINQTLKNAL